MGAGRPDRGGGEARGPAKRPNLPVDAPRFVAFQVIRAVSDNDAYANLALPGLLRERQLSGLDAAFATELTYGTLRSLGTLDRIIDRNVDREPDSAVRDALRMGAYQLLYTRVPPHAAVDTTVTLVRETVNDGAAKFANAIMRRISEHTLEDWLTTVAPDATENPAGNLAARTAHPEWIVRAFTDALGKDAAEITALLEADNVRPPVHLAARPGQITREELMAESGGSAGQWSPYAVTLAGGDPGALSSIHKGRSHVQDEGSQLVATAVVNVPVQGQDDRWLDLCAGPGGKAGLLGAFGAQRGADVLAVEVTAHRAELVAKATRGLPVYVKHADGRTVGHDPDLVEQGFDRVLVDAPCTGLGALRRRPEARWRRLPSDLPPLTKLQRELLAAAVRAVRVGGIIGYVTCSPHVTETRMTVMETLRKSKIPLELLDAREFLPAGMPGLGDGPTVQLWPHRHGTDAMFLALLRRVG
ncbi:transcription antitermination factor NusB [Longispora sp. NPDC051575]|uniref:RsmB/NOP family class I SAM-dependent RNA methyltransferase n=1 Tax=Longispora sp. NPDC051575 TaxID=3154943 RepID=UPI003443EAFA